LKDGIFTALFDKQTMDGTEHNTPLHTTNIIEGIFSQRFLTTYYGSFHNLPAARGQHFKKLIKFCHPFYVLKSKKL